MLHGGGERVTELKKGKRSLRNSSALLLGWEQMDPPPGLGFTRQNWDTSEVFRMFPEMPKRNLQILKTFLIMNP